MKNIIWKISISSTAKCNLTLKQIDYLLSIYNDPEYKKEYFKIQNSIMDSIRGNVVAEWQCDKAMEIVKLFENNLKYKLKGDNLEIMCEYNVLLSDSFDNYDVLSWSVGIEHIKQILPRIEINNLVKGKPTDEGIYNSFSKLLNDLSINQIFNISKI